MTIRYAVIMTTIVINIAYMNFAYTAVVFVRYWFIADWKASFHAKPATKLSDPLIITTGLIFIVLI